LLFADIAFAVAIIMFRWDWRGRSITNVALGRVGRSNWARRKVSIPLGGSGMRYGWTSAIAFGGRRPVRDGPMRRRRLKARVAVRLSSDDGGRADEEEKSKG